MVEDGQGNVHINFGQRKEPSRRSYSANSFLETRTPSRRSNVQSNFQLRLEEIDFSPTIPDLKYKTQEENLSNISPTHSQMMSPDELTQLMMMTEIFEIDKKYIRKWAKSEKYKNKAKLFFSTLTNEQK